MIKSILFPFLVFIATNGLCQGKFVEIPTLNLKGYLFEENYIPRFKIENFDGRFTPDIFDIQVCEELLSHFDTLNRKRSKKLRRQYLGLTRSNSMFILVHVMVYASEKQFKADFPEWTEFSVLLTDFRDKQKSLLYIVDVSEKMIGFY